MVGTLYIIETIGTTEKWCHNSPHVRLGFHSRFGPVRYSVQELGHIPDAQVGQTIAVMRSRTRADSQDYWFRARAQALLGAGDDWSKIAAAHAHARSQIRFEQDERTGSGIEGLQADIVEVLVRPRDMARYVDEGIAAGDCDDFSMYVAALLESCGIPCAFATLAADPRDPQQFSHVYCVAYPRTPSGTERVAIDASHGERPGWEAPNRFGKFQEWPVNSFAGEFMAGLASSLAAIWLYHQYRRGAFA